MSDIELVIKIPEELYEAYKGRPPMLGDAGMDMIVQAIAKGTPLPKGHGRLGDLDKLYKKFISIEPLYRTKEWIAEAPTIIEADKTESEE